MKWALLSAALLVIASATAKKVMTEVPSLGEAARDPAICGRATLAMVVSSAVMMVASMIEMVIMPRFLTGSADVAAMLAMESVRRAARSAAAR